jgi:hypothetical protein
MQILRRDLEKALKEKYFNEAEVNTNVFEGWKPDEKNEVHAIQWESVDVKKLPPILVIGITRLINGVSGNQYISTKLNDCFEVPSVRS